MEVPPNLVIIGHCSSSSVTVPRVRETKNPEDDTAARWQAQKRGLLGRAVGWALRHTPARGTGLEHITLVTQADGEALAHRLRVSLGHAPRTWVMELITNQWPLRLVTEAGRAGHPAGGPRAEVMAVLPQEERAGW